MRVTSFNSRSLRRACCLAGLLVMVAGGVVCGQQADSREAPAEAEAAVRQVLLDTYVAGLFVDRDEDAVREGIHPEFMMLVYDDGELLQVPLQLWLDNLELDGVPTSDTIRPVFRNVDVTGNTAMATLEIHENGEHIYTDYLGLYRFAEGWRIVSKIYYGH